MPIRKSRVSGTPSGTTADRPSNPSVGDTFFNGTLGVQEIYTSSGWLPATGANDFNVVLTGSETSVTLDKEYFSGSYTVTSSLSDTTFDIYLFDTSNNAAGYSNITSISATGNFNKVVIYGGTSGDLLSFVYKTTFTTSSSTADTFAAPYVSSINVADLPNIDDTTTISGGNFDTDVQVWFDGQNDYSKQAKSIVYGSSTSIVATRPDDLLEDNSPYTIRVVNPGIPSPAGSNKNKLVDSITAGGDPVWVTASGLIITGSSGDSVSTTLSATDPDGGTISYSVVSGSLTAGLALNSSTGEISGVLSGGGSSFVVAATDSGGNTTNRSFSTSVSVASGGTIADSGGYRYHTFTASNTFQADIDIASAEILAVGGGGAGGSGYYGGGGGSGGLVFKQQTISAGSYSIAIGSGGTQTTSTTVAGGNGVNTTAFGHTALGGGGGASRSQTTGQPGGSGGGYGNGGLGHDQGGAAGLQPTSASGGFGNAGGDGGYGGGGGGAGAPGVDGGRSVPYGGNGGIGLNTWSAWAAATSTGESGYYAGGGGAGRTSASISDGGLGGGGNGAQGSGAIAEFGQTNTGGGGGGGTDVEQGGAITVGTTSIGGGGGSGIVIVRYPI